MRPRYVLFVWAEFAPGSDIVYSGKRKFLLRYDFCITPKRLPHPFARDFPDPDALRREIRQTVLHELAYHFGLSDERLEELGAC